MTSENDVKEAERNLLVTLLRTLASPKIIGLVTTLVIATCGYAVYWLQSHTAEPTESTMSAPAADYCCAVQKAAQGNQAVSTNSLAKAFMLGCALSSCKPIPTPTPPGPSPVVDAGPSPQPVVEFPACKPQGIMQAPDPKKIEGYKRTLKPRHKVQAPDNLGFQLFNAPMTSFVWRSNDLFCGNQGNVGACEAFTQVDIATSQPRLLAFPRQSDFNSYALTAYSWITAHDPYPGQWPPTDTGSDSLSGCKWLVQNGFAKSCNVLVGSAAILDAIQRGPIIVGMNWLSNMYVPDRCGNLSISGTVDGGHAESLAGYDLQNDRWLVQNHWDNDWGVCLGTHCGYHWLTTQQLMSTQLDADFVEPVQ